MYVCTYAIFLTVSIFVFMYLQNCTVASSIKLSCLIPTLNAKNIAVGTNLEYSLKFDNQELNNLSSIQPLTVVPDPVFTSLGSFYYVYHSDQTITIQVQTYRLICNAFGYN